MSGVQLTVQLLCVSSRRGKNLCEKTDDFFFLPNFLQNYKSPPSLSVYLPPDATGVSIFSPYGPHAKSDQLLIAVLPKWTSLAPSELWKFFFKQVYSCVLHICLICRGELREEKSQNTHAWMVFPLTSLRGNTTHTHTHTEYKNSTEHLKTKFFIYFVTRSYSFPESSHSDTTVTQDKSIWHVAIKAKTSTESPDY